MWSHANGNCLLHAHYDPRDGGNAASAGQIGRPCGRDSRACNEEADTLKEMLGHLRITVTQRSAHRAVHVVSSAVELLLSRSPTRGKFDSTFIGKAVAPNGACASLLVRCAHSAVFKLRAQAWPG